MKQSLSTTRCQFLFGFGKFNVLYLECTSIEDLSFLGVVVVVFVAVFFVSENVCTKGGN